MNTTTLDNGVRIVSETTGGGPCAVALWVDAGSIDESATEHGLAHFLEHMLFKGTTTRGIGVSAQEIESLGGDLNAWTSLEQTVLYATVPQGWRTALEVLVDMARRPVLDPEELSRESEVVLEEIAGDDDNPDDALSQAVAAQLWSRHPYGRRVLGDADQVAGFRAEDVARFLHTHWTSERLVLSVVSDAPHEDVVQAATALLGDWHQGAPRATPPSPAPAAPTVVCVESYASTGLEMAWRVPPIGHADLPALEVLATLLANGGGGWLGEALNNQDDPGFMAWTDLDARRHGSEFRIGLVPHENKAEACLVVVRDTLARLARFIDGPAVRRAIAILSAEALSANEDVEERASDQAWYWSMHGRPEAVRQHRRALTAVTPTDLRRVVTRWLPMNAAFIGVMGEESSSLPDRLRTLAMAPLKTRRGDVDTCTPEGTRVIIRPNDSPLVAVRILAEGGSRRAHLAGLPRAWSEMVLYGAGPYGSHAFPRAVDAIGANLRPMASRHTLGFRATAPAENVVQLLTLLGHAMTDPHFDDEHWTAQRDEMLDELRTLVDRPGTLAATLARGRLWSRHPWRHPSQGTVASLQRIRGRTLHRWHAEHFTAPATLVVVSGDVDPAAVLDALEWVDDLPREAFAPPPVPTPVLRPGRVRGTGGQHQAHVGLYGHGTRITDMDRRGLELATSLLEGQAGRLFMELRERQALAYDVWAAQFEGIDGGSFGIGLSTRPESAAKAARALRGMLEDLAQTPPTPQELERARATLLGGVELSRQRIAHRVSALAANTLLDLPVDPDIWREAVRRTTGADVQQEVQRVLDAGLVDVRITP